VLATPDLLKRGFHPHAVLSNFGAAAVAAKLRKFDAETTLQALSIALSHASGTTEYTSTGGSIKRVHAGIGTRNGIVSAEMARAGITGPRSFLSGNKGFFRTFLQRGPGERADSVRADQPFEIGTVWLKAYCACYCATRTSCGSSSCRAHRHMQTAAASHRRSTWSSVPPTLTPTSRRTSARPVQPADQMAFALLGKCGYRSTATTSTARSTWTR
jgi:hypothetical protein